MYSLNGIKCIDFNDEKTDELILRYVSLKLIESNKNISKTFNTHPTYFYDTEVTSDIASIYVDIIKNNIIKSEIDINILGDKNVKTKEGSSILEFYDEEGYSSEDDKEDLENNALKLLFQFAIDESSKIENYPSRPFVITSERVGCLVFQKDIDGASLKLQDFLNDSIEQFDENDEMVEFIRKLHRLTLGNRANLAVPVRKNLLAVRNAENELKKESYLKKEHSYVAKALTNIVKGSFKVEGGTLIYKSEDESYQLPITVTSSSIKSLFLIDLYINSLAKKGDVLLIDEPELNLHPDNQRLMAKVICRLVNAGIKVLITTHSDYLIRELNNAIMLSSDFKGKSEFMEKHDIQDYDIINPDSVSAYSVSFSGLVNKLDVFNTGVNTEIFDALINEANDFQDEVYDYSLGDN